MIVRISGEDQYRLPDSEREPLNQLESAVAEAVESEDDDRYREAFGALLDYVRASGELLPDDELEASEVILPPADTSLHEAGREFTGEGLIPD